MAENKDIKASTAKEKKNFAIGEMVNLHQLEKWAHEKKRILLPALLLFLLAFPFILSNQYLLTVTIKIGIYSILALGLNVLTGYTGLVSRSLLQCDSFHESRDAILPICSFRDAFSRGNRCSSGASQFACNRNLSLDYYFGVRRDYENDSDELAKCYRWNFGNKEYTET